MKKLMVLFCVSAIASTGFAFGQISAQEITNATGVYKLVKAGAQIRGSISYVCEPAIYIRSSVSSEGAVNWIQVASASSAESEEFRSEHVFAIEKTAARGQSKEYGDRNSVLTGGGARSTTLINPSGVESLVTYEMKLKGDDKVVIKASNDATSLFFDAVEAFATVVGVAEPMEKACEYQKVR